MLGRSTLLTLPFLVTAATARDGVPPPFFRFAASEAAPCTCRGSGGPVEVGQETCLITPSGGRRARCVMVQNNTSWTISTEGCGASASLGR